jgi:steroid delta-isomerase-like uncharacterized protein
MGVTVETHDQLDPQFVEEWATRYLESWNAHDEDAVVSMCTEDVVWNDPALSEPAHGREGVRAFLRATVRAFPDFHVEETGSHFLSGAEPRVLSPYRMTATMLGDWEGSNIAATGARISVVGVDEWTFRDELMCHYNSYYDSLDMARQLGLLPPVGSGVERAMARLQHVQARFQRRKAGRPPR